jgi:hypothetical protein
VTMLDRLLGGLLLGATGGGSEFVLSLFDAKGELARLSGGLVHGLSTRLHGLSRFDRTERLTAAHFTYDLGEDTIWHGLEPLTMGLDVNARETLITEVETTTAFGVLSEELTISVTHALINMWVTSSGPGQYRRARTALRRLPHGHRRKPARGGHQEQERLLCPRPTATRRRPRLTIPRLPLIGRAGCVPHADRRRPTSGMSVRLIGGTAATPRGGTTGHSTARRSWCSTRERELAAGDLRRG